jgi:prolyl oligopeptidase
MLNAFFRNLSAITLSLGIVHASSECLEYPLTEQIAHDEDYFGTNVADPFRWLEDLNSEKTQSWIKQQNACASEYFANLPSRQEIKNRLKELINFPKISLPLRVGNYLFLSKNEGLQNQNVIYIQKGLEGNSEVFIDPNALSPDGTTSVRLLGSSNDDRYIGFSLSESGSDWETIRIMEIETKKLLEDRLQHVKFPSIAWKGNGFYYTRFNEESLFELSTTAKIYFHNLGTPQEEDQFVFADSRFPNFNYSVQTTEDEQHLFIYLFKGTSGGNDVFYKNLTKDNSEFQPLINGYKDSFFVRDVTNDSILVYTDHKAPNGRIIRIDLKNPSEENWVDVIPEKKNSLESVTTVGNKLITLYLENGVSHVYQYDFQGVLEYEIKPPSIGTISLSGGSKNDTSFFYSFTSFTHPAVIYQFDITTGFSEIWQKSTSTVNPEDYETKQVFFSSKDGTQIPLFIVHKKGIKLDQSNSTLLYGYGGFQSCMMPSFSASRMILLENGGVLAIALLRGGGEYGTKWHEGGKLLNKQNVFDDFIAAAEFLIHEGYTSSEKLGIHGASNGGLLVGACMTQRPDLFKVCFPEVGVLDMLRFHLFTVGHFWISEYGSSKDYEHFFNLYSYSPLHNIKEGVNYPATFIMTGDHDNRVFPAHSFKFAAALQAKSTKKNPILIRINKNTGHGAGKPLSKYIDEQAEFWSFFFENTSHAGL